MDEAGWERIRPLWEEENDGMWEDFKATAIFWQGQVAAAAAAAAASTAADEDEGAGKAGDT